MKTTQDNTTKKKKKKKIKYITRQARTYTQINTHTQTHTQKKKQSWVETNETWCKSTLRSCVEIRIWNYKYVGCLRNISHVLSQVKQEDGIWKKKAVEKVESPWDNAYTTDKYINCIAWLKFENRIFFLMKIRRKIRALLSFTRCIYKYNYNRRSLYIRICIYI